jgi:phosphatidate cytidylyltransferase
MTETTRNPLPASHINRLITAVCLLSVVAAALIWPDPLLFPLILAVSLAAQWEFYGLAWKGPSRLALKLTGLVLGAGMILVMAQDRHLGALTLCLISLWVENVRFLAAFGTGQKTGQSARMTAGLLYVPAALGLLFSMSVTEIVLVLLVVIAADAGAYYAGTLFGKTAFWAKISPHKTWEGFCGGLAATVAAVMIYGKMFGVASKGGFFALGLWLFFAALTGDFVESALKRHHGVKDAGAILPGHGGMLDRIDSLLAVVPAYALIKYSYPMFG